MKKVLEVGTTEGREPYIRLGFMSALIIVVLVPLSFAPDLTRSTFAIVKATVFALAVLGLALSLLLKQRAAGDTMLSVPYYAIPMLAFAAVHVFATIASVDFRESLFGAYDRFEGLLVIIGYVLVGLVIPSVIDRKKIDHLLTAWLITGILVSGYGLLQYAGLDFQDWQASYVGTRVFSTLGNPLVLSGYIVLTLPIAYMRIIGHRDMISIVFALLGIPALLLTYSRSGWLAFIVTTILFVLFALWYVRVRKPLIAYRPPFLRVLLILAVAVLVIAGALGDIGARLVSVADWQSGAIAARFNLWKLVVSMISERPFLGYGPETFLQVSNRFIDLTQQSIEINTRYDRPHSDVLQVAFSTGFIGLLAYLAFISTYFMGVLRFLKQTERSSDMLPVAGLALGVLGYLITIQFFFSTVFVTPLMWLAIGLTGALIDTERGVLRRRSARSAVAAITGLSLFLLLPHLLTFTADVMSQQSHLAEMKGDRAYAVDRAALAARLSPWQVEYALRKGEALDRHGDLSGAIAAYKQAAEVSPGRYEGYAYLASIYYERNDATGAVYYALEALQRYPLHYESRLVYALVSTMDGERSIAEENLLQLQEVDPNDYRAFLYLGRLYRDTGRVDLAHEQLSKALAVCPDNPDIQNALAGLRTGER